MTIQELYDLAVKNNCQNYDLVLHLSCTELLVLPENVKIIEDEEFVALKYSEEVLNSVGVF